MQGGGKAEEEKMARYIDADALKEYFSYSARLCEDIDKFPTADVVEVVRCKDCRYFEPEKYSESWCHVWGRRTSIGEFCSCGRREDG